MPEYRIDANGNAVVIDDDSNKQLTSPHKKKKTSQYLILACVAIVCWYILFRPNSSPEISAVNLGNSNIPVASSQTTRVSFTAPSAGTYVFTSTGQNDTYGYIFESATTSSALAYDDDSGSNQNFRIERTLGAGQNIFIGVKFYASNQSGNISLQISKVSTTSSILTSSPQPIVQQVQTGNHTIAVTAGHTERVKFVAPSAGTYVFTGTSTSDTVGYLFSSETSNTALAQNDDYNGSSNFRFEYALSASQTVYVGVKFYSADRSGNITLSISKVSTTTVPSTTSSPVQQVRTGNNTVSIRAGQITRVKFVAPSTGTYIIKTNGSTDTYGYLYSSPTSTSPIKENDDYAGDQDFQITHSLSANQTIYIGVRFFNSTSSGNVTLHITKQTSSSAKSTSRWPVGENCRVYVGSGHARTGPGVAYAHAAYIKEGDSFEILECRLGDTGKDWYKIRHDGLLCWVSSGLVELNGNKNGTRNGVPITN